MRFKIQVREERPKKLVFARLNDDGDVIRVLARRSVRRDTVKLRFERGGRYVIRVGNERQTYEVCARDGGTASLRILSPVIAVGGTVRFQLLNTSRNHACLSGAFYGGWIEHLEPDGTWSQTVPPSTLLAGLVLSPWHPHEREIALPATARPGTYRVGDNVKRNVQGGSENLPLSAEFAVRP